jgi:hypothetical protein
VRKKAFAIIEATDSPRAGIMALQALDDDDEEIRFRAIQVLLKYPTRRRSPLLKHCRNDCTGSRTPPSRPGPAGQCVMNDEVLPRSRRQP